jgi:hypothetical protein
MNLVPGANPDQEGMSEHHERDVPQPPEEAADARSGPAPDLSRFPNPPQYASLSPIAFTISASEVPGGAKTK